MKTQATIYREEREQRSKKNAASAASSIKLLQDREIKYTTFNGGAHLVIRHGDDQVNFWPSTGNWNVIGQRGSHRGVFELLKFLKGEAHE